MPTFVSITDHLCTSQTFHIIPKASDIILPFELIVWLLDFSDEWTSFQKRVDGDASKTFCPPMCNTKAKGIANNDPVGAESALLTGN